ncbi:MAG: Asp23/Gls24 family envelope stress response protein [Anaerolineae bacterium]|nr:Asp23/Gls24 family envelope stress response protein [Anaerolineae bacterium]MCB9129824.1 Asp23/Gls24 family envelope stress response protein [Anaerolineales bacterium]MCB0229862.1 Asp23/Gls24 family envelope stress response protein [Anaerolineae bacterium]MCB0234819.1 Asp23/Gls24 family envelope stress response protein [Anaerolineae bacterium]MCB0241329.1 Asp23/Gls24 family envelope stress response protein [Anaerolineae bacterium]
MDEQYEMPPGEVIIAPGVLVTIVAMTAQAQRGVLRLSPRTPSPGLGRIRPRGATAEGLRIDLLDDGSVAVEVHVIADPSARLQDLGKVLQSEIARALEHMAGTPVEAVNVFIDEVEFDGSELKS